MAETNGVKTARERAGVAIIGMACMFPGAPDLDTYWQNIVNKVDCVTDPPPEAWDSDVYYDPDSTANDRVYCKKGGYLGPLAYFDPLEHGIPPVAVGGEPDQWLALKLAREALADAGYPEGMEDGKRTAVILGKGTYLNAGNMSMVQHGLVLDQTVRVLRSLHPEYSDEELARIRRELKDSLPAVTAETVPGLIPNIIAGRIANRMDFMGPSYTVDAACASTLIAVDNAMRDLAEGRSDLVVAGGSQVSTPVPIASVFCQLGALSRRQQIRPFDKDADGTILGEGIGMIVLKRLRDAERDGDRIYAVIRGVGVSSDGRGVSVMAPRVEGEEMALRRAYEMAGVSPHSVGLIEAHGTATAAGDAAEIEALTRVFGEHQNGDRPQWCAVGSVKSMIGHTMPASGAASLIKTALALYHKVLPPTLNCDEPNPKLRLHETPFYVNTTTRPWIHGRATPRRAGVNSFGFGGVNAHVVLEEYAPAKAVDAPSHMPRWDSELCVLEAATRDELVQSLRELQAHLEGAPQTELKDLAYTLNTALEDKPNRLALVAESVEDLGKKLARALERLSDAECRQIKDRGGVYFFEEPLSASGGKLAFLFPGEGAQYPGMLSDLCVHFPEVRECFDQLDRLFVDLPGKLPPSGYIFPRPALSEAEREAAASRLFEIDGAVEGVLTANHAMATLLAELGVQPGAIVGHSTGEYSAMRAAGIIDLSDEATFRRFALDMNGMYEREAAGDGVPRATLVAVGADREQVSAAVREAGGDLFLAMDNCPHQSVIVGDPGAAERAVVKLRALGLICDPLPFDRAYHTPLFERYADGLRSFFEAMPMSKARIETWSCTTSAPYPEDVADIRRLVVDHWVQPVEFRKTIEAMYEAGVRLFVEVGPRGNLTTFVEDILRGRPHLAVPSNVQRRSGITQLNHLLAILAAQGVPMRMEHLYARRSPKLLSLGDTGAATDGASKSRVKLATGWPPMNISEETAQSLRSRTNGGASAIAPATDQANAQPTFVEPQAAAPNGSAAAPSGAPPVPAAAGGQAMEAYLQTMDQFLVAQQDVMQAFLGARGPAMALSAPAEALAQPAVAPQPVVAMPQPAAVEVRIDAPAVAQAEATADESPATMKQELLDLVSDRTGYPTDILDMEMDIEADLGIDSIKRVEILGAFLAAHGAQQDERMESIGELKTLQQMLGFLSEVCGAPAALAVGEASANGADKAPSRPASDVRYPFLERIVSLIPGRELIAIKELRWDEDLFLHDHTLGRRVSTDDDTLRGLPIVPLTMSMEMLASAGAALMPGRVLVSMKDVKANRWIKLEGEKTAVEIVAHVNAAGEVEAQVLQVDEPEGGEPTATDKLVEGTLVFADAYPEAPQAAELSLSGERPSSWTPERLYSEGMFHGPRWQGVASVDRWGEDGTAATMRVLPFEGYFRSDPAPAFVTDPVVLDAAGQLVGFWTQEHLESGAIVFPFHVRELQIFGPNLPAGAQVRGQARIALNGESHVSSDIDMIDSGGRLWMRLIGWADKRFHLPPALYRFLLSPAEHTLAERSSLPLAGEAASALHCFRISDPIQADRAFWTSVFAHLVLNEAERATFRSLKARRMDWLMGRVAAKDAVRSLLKDSYGLELCPADVEIRKGKNGEPIATGNWTAIVAAVPSLTLAHSEGTAIAVAGPGDGARLGVDIERVRTQPAGFEAQAFVPEEIALLDSLPPDDRDEWVIRLWCAKEAVGKALGRGLVEGPRGVVADRIEGSRVLARLRGRLRDEFPLLQNGSIEAYTTRQGDYVVAAVLLREETEG